MSKTKVLALTIIITLALSPLAFAKTKSFTLATAAVKTFDKKTRALLPQNLSKEQLSSLVKTSKENKKEVIAKIKSLRRSEGPSQMRFSRLLRIIESHTDKQLSDIRRFALGLNVAQREMLEDMSSELRALRDELLTELSSTSPSEVEPEGWIKAEPVIDRSPYEERPGDTRGLFDR